MSTFIEGSGLGKMCQRFAEQSPEKADELYRNALNLKDGTGTVRNLREAFKLFQEASISGHVEAIKELSECYLYGRGCEQDLIKAADLGDSKLKLEVAKKMEQKGKVNKYMRLYWEASDLGEGEATSKLVDIYRRGNIVELDTEESERLKRVLVNQFQKADVGLEWEISKEDKILFIRGSGRMANYDSNKAPWEDYKGTIQSVCH